ncbi:MAG: PDZ domain-containing protein, partial [Rhodospirillales bacterium]
MFDKIPLRALRIVTVLPLVLLLWTCSSTSGGVRERATDLGVALTDQDIELVNAVMSRVVSNALVDKSSTHLIDDALVKIRDADDVPADRTRVDVGLNAVLKDLDPYAVYLNADRTRRMRERLSGNFEGIGVFIGIRDEKLTVTSPIEGSPAMSAGLQPQDRITHVNGTPTQGLSVGEAAALMRGRRGTDVTITVQRKNQSPFDVAITRALITVPTASSRRYGDIGYIRLTQFTETTEPGLEEAVNKLVQ